MKEHLECASRVIVMAVTIAYDLITSVIEVINVWVLTYPCVCKSRTVSQIDFAFRIPAVQMNSYKSDFALPFGGSLTFERRFSGESESFAL